MNGCHIHELFGRDVNESRSRQVSKKILGLEKKMAQREISRPEICARTDVGIEVSANETRCLCSLPAVGVWLHLPPHPIPLVLPSVYLMPLIWPPPPPSLLGNYVTRSTIVCIASSFPCHWRHWSNYCVWTLYFLSHESACLAHKRRSNLRNKWI